MLSAEGLPKYRDACLPCVDCLDVFTVGCGPRAHVPEMVERTVTLSDREPVSNGAHHVGLGARAAPGTS